jgi:hypothetical protein
VVHDARALRQGLSDALQAGAEVRRESDDELAVLGSADDWPPHLRPPAGGLERAW